VLSLNRWIEDDATSLCVEAHPELDVLHRGLREPLFVETAKRQKDVTPDRAEPCPERRGSSSAFVMDVMVEEIPEIGDDAGGSGIVIVGAEDRGEARVVLEGAANPGECVAVHLDVRVDENEHIACRLPRAEVSSGCGTEVAGPVDDDELLRDAGCPVDGVDRAPQRRPSVCCRDHHR
jgi:hypothetical protein